MATCPLWLWRSPAHKNPCTETTLKHQVVCEQYRGIRTVDPQRVHGHHGLTNRSQPILTLSTSTQDKPRLYGSSHWQRNKRSCRVRVKTIANEARIYIRHPGLLGSERCQVGAPHGLLGWSRGRRSLCHQTRHLGGQAL